VSDERPESGRPDDVDAEIFEAIEEVKRLGIAEVHPDDVDKPWGEQRLVKTALGELLGPVIEAHTDEGRN
jgi:hypothetical protein